MKITYINLDTPARETTPDSYEAGTPSAPLICKEDRFWKKPALVVGLWQPGTSSVKTVALDISSQLAYNAYHASKHLYRPDFKGDIMKIPNETLGLRKYTRIVFQGCCPVAIAMGAYPCAQKDTYPKINAQELAKKVKGLISEQGGFIFFRHCLRSAHQNGIEDPIQRKQFIKSFEDENMKLMPGTLHPPLRLTHHAPDAAIPDPDSRTKNKWDFANGALIFFVPAETRIQERL